LRYAALLKDAFRKQLQKVLDNETTFEKFETGVRLSRKQRIIRNSSGKLQQSGRRLLQEQFT